TDEFHQYFVPGRCCDWKDMCIDSAGVATGCLLCLLVVLKLTRKTEMGSGTITGT
nr:VanZ family protein [Lachnospiraceae bacterium]